MTCHTLTRKASVRPAGLMFGIAPHKIKFCRSSNIFYKGSFGYPLFLYFNTKTSSYLILYIFSFDFSIVYTPDLPNFLKKLKIQVKVRG